MSTQPKLSDDELYARARELWPRITEMLRKGLDAIEEEMDKSIDSEDALKLINLLLLREVFLRKTIAIVIKRDDTEDIPAWIEQLYYDWEAEAEINGEQSES